MIQRRQAHEAKQPLRIVNGVDSPGDVINSRRDENEAMKFSAAYAQVLRDGLTAVNYLWCDAIKRDVNRATNRVELRRADCRR